MLMPHKKVSYNEALSHVIERFHRAYKFHTFVCSVCGKTIEPIIEVWGDEVFFRSDTSEMTGGIGNKTVRRNVCNDCLKEINAGINMDLTGGT